MKYKYFSLALVSKRLRCNSLKLTYYVGIEIKGRWSQCAKTYLNLRYFIEKIFIKSKHTGVTTKTANQMKPSKTTRNHPKPSETTRNHTKLSETTQTFLQPTSNYPKLPIISLKPPETPNNHPLNAFGQFYHLKFWNHTQQASLNCWRTMNILIFIFTVIADIIIIIIIITTELSGNNSINNLLHKSMSSLH